ncbi:MAG: type I phosphomannose isomerase catalytic subunit [Flavobacterium sp.]
MSHSLYPLLFQPIFKERIWGGSNLSELLNKKLPGNNIGESWELSAVDENVSKVANGALKGKTLLELIESYPEDLLGAETYKRFGNKFPLLFKFLDAQDDLSIQVHPNDIMAKKHHGGLGKTEMWYVLDAEPGAKLIVGFESETTNEQYLHALEHGSIVSLLQSYSVQRGDVFFLETGTVHAVGKGTVIAEIQQTSDLTYRIFDYNRKDANGQQRELHTDLAMEAIYFGVRNPKIEYELTTNSLQEVVNSPFFKTYVLKLDGFFNLKSIIPVFQVLMCVEGHVTVVSNSESFCFEKGDTVLLPAVLNAVTLEGKAELLVVSI